MLGGNTALALLLTISSNIAAVFTLPFLLPAALQVGGRRWCNARCAPESTCLVLAVGRTASQTVPYRLWTHPPALALCPVVFYAVPKAGTALGKCKHLSCHFIRRMAARSRAPLRADPRQTFPQASAALGGFGAAASSGAAAATAAAGPSLACSVHLDPMPLLVQLVQCILLPTLVGASLRGVSPGEIGGMPWGCTFACEAVALPPPHCTLGTVDCSAAACRGACALLHFAPAISHRNTFALFGCDALWAATRCGSHNGAAVRCLASSVLRRCAVH